MKILVVDTAASEGGALSILKDYYEDAKKNKENEYIFLVSSNYIEEGENVKVEVLPKYKKWINRLMFDGFIGKRIVAKYNPDEILSLQNTIIRGTKVKQNLYVHQPLPFQNEKNFSFFKKDEFKLAIIQKIIGKVIISSIKKCDKVIVQTCWMKKAIINKCKIDAEKIEVITPKIDLIKKIDKVKQSNKCMFFYPASNVVYKNHSVIYKAVNILENKGITNFEVHFTLNGNNTSIIKYLGKIDRNDVFKEYCSSILVFPSYIETFGLPLLEARETGSNILASDTPFSHEILDGYNKVCFFDPFDEEQLADLMLAEIKKLGE